MIISRYCKSLFFATRFHDIEGNDTLEKMSYTFKVLYKNQAESGFLYESPLNSIGWNEKICIGNVNSFQTALVLHLNPFQIV